MSNQLLDLNNVMLPAGKSGIMAPAHVLSKRVRKMARSKFLKIIRHMDFSRTIGFATRFQCVTCQKPVRLQRGDHLLIQVERENTINPKKDAFTLECACTVWRVS